MATYSIKKVNNGEFKEIEKTFVLDLNKFRGKSDTLYFNVLGEDNPLVFDLDMFERIMISQIEQGFMESLEYKDGLLIATTRDGNTIKKYTYDFGFNRLKGTSKDILENTKGICIEKYFSLDINKYRGHGDTLYFNALGEDNPLVFDLGAFINNIIVQIEQGFMESLEFKDDTLITVVYDGNTVKKYTYDFGFSSLKDSSFGMISSSSLDDLKSLIYKIVSFYNENPNNALEELKNLMFKIVSFYNENPNREIMSKQKYIRMILDIIDGDRLPKMESNDEILRVFQVYHANKGEILEVLLDNVVFYDDNGNVLDYSSFIKERKLEVIKYDILNQMEIKMLMFAVANNAYDLYQEYIDNTHIMPVEIQYKYVDEEGNEVEPPVEEYEAGTILSVGKELIGNGVRSIKNAAVLGASKVISTSSFLKEKIKSKGRTK